MIFTDFGPRLSEGRVLHKEAWVTTLLGTLLEVQDHKKVNFPGRDNSSLAVMGLIQKFAVRKQGHSENCCLWLEDRW